MPPFVCGFQCPWALPGIPHASVEEDVILILTSISDGGYYSYFLKQICLLLLLFHMYSAPPRCH